jgi:hypothetical protein
MTVVCAFKQLIQSKSPWACLLPMFRKWGRLRRIEERSFLKAGIDLSQPDRLSVRHTAVKMIQSEVFGMREACSSGNL